MISRLHRSLAIVGSLAGLVLLLTWHLPPEWLIPNTAKAGLADIGPPVPMEMLQELYEGHRLHLIQGYNPAEDEREFGFRNVSDARSRGNSNALARYAQRLRKFVVDAMPTLSPYETPLLTAIERMEHHIPTTWSTTDHSAPFLNASTSSPLSTPLHTPSRFPRAIYTTNKSKDPSSLPGIFQHWARIHKPEDGWSVEIWDDEAIEGFFLETFLGFNGMNGDQIGVYSWVEEEWKRLREPVFKADIFRYLKLLLHGGIYTDSDTAPVAPAETWGHDYKSIISPELGAVLTILKTAYALETYPLISSNASSSIGDLFPPSPASPFYDDPRSYRSPINDDGINLVIAIEVDGVNLNMGDDWRDVGMSRKLQICQWTLMAKPFHPVFLDVLEVIFTRAKSDRQRYLDGELVIEDQPTALEFTGPGPYTDAVMRYLLLAYGVMPRDLVGMSESTRIGDVLILPAYSFSQPPPQNAHAETGAVHHEYKGRWRHEEQ